MDLSLQLVTSHVSSVSVTLKEFPLGLLELGPSPYSEFAFRAVVEFILLLYPYFCFVFHGAADFKITFTLVFLNTLASTRMHFLNEISFSHVCVSLPVSCAHWVWLISVTALYCACLYTLTSGQAMC